MTVTADFGFVDRKMEFYDSEMVLFIQNEMGKNKTEGTVYKYAHGLEEFSEWLEREDISHTEVDFRDLGRYMGYLMGERGFANSTTETKFAPVNLYYKYLTKAEEIPENPTDKFNASEYIDWNKTKTEEETGDERVHLEEDELDKIVQNVPAPQLRNRLIILFTYYTGLRVSEVVNVELENINRNRREVNVEVKGGDEHTAVWHKDLNGLMRQWLDHSYRDSYPTADGSPYLFLTNRSEQISVRRVNGILDEAAENAGIQEVIYTDAAGREFKKVTPHKLRHSFAMHFLQNGGSIEALNNRLAHSSVITTEIYGEVQDDRGIKEYNEFMQSVQSDSDTEPYQCLLCGQKGNLEEHHISDNPEKTIDVCKECHQKIHHTSQYDHLLDAHCESYADK